MTNALEDLQSALLVFSGFLDRELEDNWHIDFDYEEFLTDTLPALGERIERETLEMCMKRARTLDPLDKSGMQAWIVSLGVSLPEA